LIPFAKVELPGRAVSRLPATGQEQKSAHPMMCFLFLFPAEGRIRALLLALIPPLRSNSENIVCPDRDAHKELLLKKNRPAEGERR
jgi:hypothetical protein